MPATSRSPAAAASRPPSVYTFGGTVAVGRSPAGPGRAELRAEARGLPRSLATSSATFLRNYRLSLLSLRRLDEVPLEVATAFLKRLRTASQNILIYSYDDMAATSLNHYSFLYGFDVSEGLDSQFGVRWVLLR
jgi:hypothetical protein